MWKSSCILWIWHCVLDVNRKKWLQAGTDENTCKMKKKEDPSHHSVIFRDLRKSCSVFGTFALVQIKQTREGWRDFQSTWGSYWFLLLSETDSEFNTSIFFPSLRFHFIYLFSLFFSSSFHSLTTFLKRVLI